ncbi:MAG TPA: HAD hydrolase-like protein [bacterium]|nr:HAD hydrolase-like protein [bacterium]
MVPVSAARRSILFDLDGTLSDPKLGITRSIRHAFEQLGRPLDPGLDLDFCIGPPLLQSLQGLLGPGQAQLGPQALAHYRQRYQALGLYENTVYPGIPEALDGLGPAADLYVATSKPTVFALAILEHFNLSRHFKGIHGSELDGARSDKGDLIAHVLKAEGLAAADTLMVGDREHDLLGAAKHGVRGVGALWGYGSRQELLAAGAWGLLGSPAELAGLL